MGSELGSYWLSHMHPDKCRTCAPGNWCYLKENRFAEGTLVGFSVWQAQKTWTGVDYPEFTVGVVTTKRAGKDTFFFFLHLWLVSVTSPPYSIFYEQNEGTHTLQWPMSMTKEAGRSIQLLRRWTRQTKIWVEFPTRTQVSFVTFRKPFSCLGCWAGLRKHPSLLPFSAPLCLFCLLSLGAFEGVFRDHQFWAAALRFLLGTPQRAAFLHVMWSWCAWDIMDRLDRETSSIVCPRPLLHYLHLLQYTLSKQFCLQQLLEEVPW